LRRRRFVGNEAEFHSFYLKKITKCGVIAGILIGTATEIAWYSVPELKAIISEWAPASILSFIAVIVASILTSMPEDAAEMLEIMKGPR